MRHTQTPSSRPLVITGISGAGLSAVLKAIEDLGFEVFDNFPLSLVPPLMADTRDQGALAIGIDSRTRGFCPRAVLETVKDIGAQLVFITCDDAVLQRRFTETRRRHPLAKDKPVILGIQKERALLTPIMEQADLTIDTSDLSIHDLRHILEGHFGRRGGDHLNISLMSFGFRYGLPREADIVMDVRFLKNPHWDKALKPQTGLEEDVGAYISQDPAFGDFLKHFKALLTPLFSLYGAEGKNYLTLAIGCTGGRHRSVFTIETLGKWLKDQGYNVHIHHRDIKR